MYPRPAEAYQRSIGGYMNCVDLIWISTFRALGPSMAPITCQHILLLSAAFCIWQRDCQSGLSLLPRYGSKMKDYMWILEYATCQRSAESKITQVSRTQAAVPYPTIDACSTIHPLPKFMVQRYPLKPFHWFPKASSPPPRSPPAP